MLLEVIATLSFNIKLNNKGMICYKWSESVRSVVMRGMAFVENSDPESSLHIETGRDSVFLSTSRPI